MTSTAIKLAGGVSAKDAHAMARDMRCAPEFLQEMRKHPAHAEFACFIRNVTPCPVKLSVPFGQMESRPRMSEAEFRELLQQNARRYCAGSTGPSHHAPEADDEDIGDPKVL
jgi:hypothetical protein